MSRLCFPVEVGMEMSPSSRRRWSDETVFIFQYSPETRSIIKLRRSRHLFDLVGAHLYFNTMLL